MNRKIFRFSICALVLLCGISVVSAPKKEKKKKKKPSVYGKANEAFKKQARNLCEAISPKGYELLKPIVLKYPKFDRDAFHKAYEKENPETPEKRYSKERLVKLKLKAEKVFKPIEIGDEITVTSRKYVYEGKFGGIAKGKMKIGDKYAPIVDLSPHIVDRTKPDLMVTRKMEYLQRKYYTPKKDYEIAYKTERLAAYRKVVADYFNKKLDFVEKEVDKLAKTYPSVRGKDLDQYIGIEDKTEIDAIRELITKRVYEQQPLKKELSVVIAEEVKKLAENNENFVFYENKFITKEKHKQLLKEKAEKEAKEKAEKERQEKLAREKAEKERLDRLEQEKTEREQAIKERAKRRRKLKFQNQIEDDRVRDIYAYWKKFAETVEEHRKKREEEKTSEPPFKNTKKFSGPDALGLYCVSADGTKFGYMNSKGEPVVPEKFEEATGFEYRYPFNAPVAIVKTNGKYGIIELRTKKKLLGVTYKDYFIIQPKYDKIVLLSTETVPCELIKVMTNGKYSVINKREEKKVVGEFDDIEILRPGILRVKDDGKFGLSQTNGKELIPPELDRIEVIKNTPPETEQQGDILSITNACAKVYADGQIGLIDKYGNYLVKPKFKDIGTITEEGFALATDSSKWGVVNQYGYYVIVPRFEKDEVFVKGKTSDPDKKIPSYGLYDGLLRTRDKADGKFKFYDSTGKLAFELQTDFVSNFSNGLAVFLDRESGKYGYLNKLGKVAIKPAYVDAYPFSDGLAAVKLDQKWGCIDQNGKLVINATYEAPLIFEDGKAKVQVDGKETFVDKTGKQMTSAE